MTDYRNKHKVCIVRDADPGASRPHQLESNGGFLGWTGSVMAEVLHEAGIPWSTDEPLPEGVFRSPDGRLLASVKDAEPLVESGGWGAYLSLRGGQAIVEVRRPKPAPKTDRVPLHKLIGWRLPGMDIPVTSWVCEDGLYRAGSVNFFEVGEDGMVEVLAEGDES